MRKELDHFWIGKSCGGDQEWFPGFWMKIGGCGAVSACDLCIYLAVHKQMPRFYPYDPAHVTREDYLNFGEQMRSYLSPRPTGINKTEIYVDGFNAYMDRYVGGRPLKLENFSGHEDAQDAAAQIRDQIDRGFPVPYLMLLHHDKKLKDYMWHWFLLNGYDEEEGQFRVRAVTYGEQVWMDFYHLWQTEMKEKGGFVVIR